MLSLNPWVYVAVLAGFIMLTGFVGYKSYTAGANSVRAEWQAATLKKTDEKLTVKAKQDVIQNAPIDVGVTTRRLRKGTF